ncbi:MAG: polynucleotide adenylyltransferase [Verrucomicrobia bacterium]|nr:polynucleotide adenylyltransferase [Verrucomicrobiota bacterium]
MTEFIPAELVRILTDTPELGTARLVGGCVRDWLLGRAPKDFDVEVYGLDAARLGSALARWGQVNWVGRSFGVLKVTTAGGQTFDFSLPRRDSKVAPGHRGFEVAVDPGITPREAAERRDFTINALAYDPRERRVFDYFGGQADLRNRVLRHTSPAFADDPLRVLRGMQFAGRFALEPAPGTVALCRQIKSGYAELAVERVREEWFKWAAESALPSAGLRFLAATEWIAHFPELDALVGVPQDPEWHPEGDVFAHTCHCCDALARLPAWQAADTESRVAWMLAVLAHDFGKAATTCTMIRNGRTRIVSPEHDERGVPLAEAFLARINAPHAIRARVLPLVRCHMAHLNPIHDRSVRRLARRLAPETIESLCLVITADASGRPPNPPGVPEAVATLRARAGALELEAAAPRPILLGRHLLDLGMVPGKELGIILNAAFEAQLEGLFADLPGAWRWLATQSASGLPAPAQQVLRQKLADHPPG